MTKPFIDHSAFAKCSAAVIVNSKGEQVGTIRIAHSPGAHKSRIHMFGDKVTPPSKNYYPTDSIIAEMDKQGFNALGFQKQYIYYHRGGLNRIGRPSDIHYFKKGNTIFKVFWAIS